VDQGTRDLVARYTAISACLFGASRRAADAARELRAAGYSLPGDWRRAVVLNAERGFPPPADGPGRVEIDLAQCPWAAPLTGPLADWHALRRALEGLWDLLPEEARQELRPPPAA
jgi:hypothetical protein